MKIKGKINATAWPFRRDYVALKSGCFHVKTQFPGLVIEKYVLQV